MLTCTGPRPRGRWREGPRRRHGSKSRAQPLAHTRRDHDQQTEADAKRNGPRLGAEDQRREQDERAQRDQSYEARDPEWSPAHQEFLDRVALDRTHEEADSDARAKPQLPGQAGHGDCRRCHQRAADRRHSGYAARLHLESSRTFNQMPAAPATRPTNSPTRTKTGAVFSALSSATPPMIGSRTAAARQI